jgi:hypothetical protein
MCRYESDGTLTFFAQWGTAVATPIIVQGRLWA